MISLVDFVRSHVDAKKFWEDHFDEHIYWPPGSEGRIGCCFHADKSTPSLSLNPDNGRWYCHGCEKGGKSIVSFYAEYNNISMREASIELFNKYIHPTIPDKTVRRWVRRMRETPTALRYAKRQRFIKGSVTQKYEIGYNGNRFTFPIRNEFGLCVNVKMHDPLAKSRRLPKQVNYQDAANPDLHYGQPIMVWPLDQFDNAKEKGFVVLCEGEWDTLLMISMGLPAVTMTGGSKSWAKQYTSKFRGLEVIIAYDNDQDGDKYGRKVSKHIRKVAKRIRRLTIPKLKMGPGKKTKDLTDWFHASPEMRTPEAWLRVMQDSKLILENDDDVIEASEVKYVALDQASRAEWLNRRIEVDAIITGKDLAPYILPEKFRVTCNKSCDDCPLAEHDGEWKDLKLNPNDPSVLNLIDANQSTVRKSLLAMAGMKDKAECGVKLEVTKSFNIEELILIPTLESKTQQYVTRRAFFVGHGLHSNRSYRFEGVTTANPQDQHATHLFDKARPVQDEIENFQMTPELNHQLRIFRPKKLKPMAQLMSIAEWQSRNITKIVERHDLHIAVDLVFHSAASFDFNGEFVKRGMLDVLVIGDTRCGKGYVTEGLAKYYGLGEVASGENCSFAGLVGGLQNTGKRWLITWGLIPLNHNRLVVLDEASSLSEKEISEMSRVRSEGVAEISKIIRETTQANTRLLWLSNTRNGEAIGKLPHGVLAVKDLMGANEDISRFDFALTVATSEVSSEVINDLDRAVRDDADRYPRELARSLVLWAWSRTPDQIKFTPEATKAALQQAVEFGKTYSPKIPLVQGENIRIKIAKIAASIAARLYSTDHSGEQLIIDKEHVECACQFLRMIYSKESMRYDVYSKAAIETSVVADVRGISKIFENLGADKDTVLHAMSNLYRVTPDNMSDYVGDLTVARSFISELVKLNCLTRIDSGGGYYLKNPSFNSWLRSHNGQGVWYANGAFDKRPGRRAKGSRRVSR